MTHNSEPHASKVPEVTLGFWIIKILATTLGETAGDTVTMTWLRADVVVNSGYLVGSAIFLSVLIVLVGIQIAARNSTRSFIGPSSSPQRPPAQPWLTLPRALWVSATQGDH